MEESTTVDQMPTPKKPRLVFTDLQRRTLQAIFKVEGDKLYRALPNFCMLQETKRPLKEMQVTIARQLGLEPTTVGNFFMNARRRSMDKWKDDPKSASNLMHQQLSPDMDQDDTDDIYYDVDDHEEVL